jgi:hypothetical protein
MPSAYAADTKPGAVPLADIGSSSRDKQLVGKIVFILYISAAANGRS